MDTYFVIPVETVWALSSGNILKLNQPNLFHKNYRKIDLLMYWAHNLSFTWIFSLMKILISLIISRFAKSHKKLLQTAFLVKIHRYTASLS